MTDWTEIQKIIKIIRDKINDDTDVVWAGYDSAKILQTELDEDINKLGQGDFTILSKLNLMFAPTSTFQELSVSNNWGQEYIQLSGKFDKHYDKIFSDNN